MIFRNGKNKNSKVNYNLLASQYIWTGFNGQPR
jgi:hypothetical protein